MPRTLYDFIWRYSLREQILLLALTVATFPLLYATLELPKTIVNDAIGGTTFPQTIFGVEFDQIPYLWALCGAYLFFVVAGGLMKMRLNTQKGVVAERLLRRLRYQLISRALRFPLPHYKRTSQGELIAVITSETEPLGGLMGDALAQPVFQGGQMLTILLFLFIQSPWLGLAAIALIPLQAWLIPLIQRRVNRLNKDRVRRVRRLAERIGESVEGVEDLRANNGVAYTLAEFSEQLGGMFRVRFKIYQLKFLMKFLNNFINQLTPFFFYLIGGMLAIDGQISVGALVAAIASYKDLTSPWKELLDYYNQSIDLSLRYTLVAERFEPEGMLDENLFEGRPESLPRLDGAIRFENVTVRSDGGDPILRAITAEIPAGASVAIKVTDAAARGALAQLFARTRLPNGGRMLVGEHDLARLHQEVIATRIGVASSAPHFFDATIAENVQIALRHRPKDRPETDIEDDDDFAEALASGNSRASTRARWLDASVAGFASEEALRDWWRALIEAAGSGDALFRRGLDAYVDSDRFGDLAAAAVALRPRIAARLREAGALDAVDRFDPSRFNASLTVFENILMATPRLVDGRPPSMAGFAADPRLIETLDALDLTDRFRARALDLLGALVDAFSEISPDHPIFQRLGDIDGATFERMKAAHTLASAGGFEALDGDARHLVMSLPFRVSLAALRKARPSALKERVLDARRRAGATTRERLSDLFEPIEPDRFIGGLTLLENLVYGKIAEPGSEGAELARDLVLEEIEAAGLRRDATLLVGDVRVGVGGANLGPTARERIAVVRAGLRKPDILVLERMLASQSAAARRAARARLRALMPTATIVHLDSEFDPVEEFDLRLEIRDGRLIEPGGDGAFAAPALDSDTARDDLAAKVRVFAQMPLFANVAPRQVRLMAYSASWVRVREGGLVFRAGVEADGAYVLVAGEAELRWPDHRVGDPPISVVRPGRLIGDLSVIADWPRTFDMIATADLTALRIGRRELLDLVENDAGVATSLLRTVSSYLLLAAEELRELRGHVDPLVRLEARERARVVDEETRRAARVSRDSARQSVQED